MSFISFLVALILFFCEGLHVRTLPDPTIWGLFFLTLGLIMGHAVPFVFPWHIQRRKP
jgi:hypothetical protein